MKVLKPNKKLKNMRLLAKFSFLFLFGAMTTLGTFSLYDATTEYIATHNFRSPVVLQSPVTDKEYIQVSSPSATLKTPDEMNTEEYIKYKFGRHGEIALAVFKAESGLRDDAYNVNTNGTVDVGIAQINSIHWKKEGCSLKELLDPKKNIDCAYEIYEDSGFYPWVAFKSLAYVNQL